jgi:hypothetical protein
MRLHSPLLRSIGLAFDSRFMTTNLSARCSKGNLENHPLKS